MPRFVFGGLFSLILTIGVSAQPTPPCGDVWGSKEDAKAIQTAMFEADEKNVIAAVNRAKETRGNRVGCSEAVYTHDKPDFGEQKSAALIELWNKKYAPAVSAYQIGCPTAARNWAFAALGAYYARLAGQKADERALGDIARLYEATQYKPQNAPFPAASPAGVFGYIAIAPDDPCFDKTNIAGKPLGVIIKEMCDKQTFACAVYDNGIFKGKQFLIADTNPATKTFDGGAAYDHAVAGVMMIEAAVQSPNAADRKLFLASAKMAGDWAISETPVRNHNYTAKLVWLLAQIYDLTGEGKYKTALLDKLNRNLKPGVLMDADGDGNVDGMTKQPFAKLTPVARKPGRIWDGHNARPTYHAMNAWAFVAAYVALRDRGQKAEAAKVKPYMLAMLDNIVWETNNLGVPTSGRPMIPYALLLALWKVSAVENQPQPEWEKAVRAFWNTGIFNSPAADSPGEGSLNTGLYLLYKSRVKYQPLHQRSR